MWGVNENRLGLLQSSLLDVLSNSIQKNILRRMKQLVFKIILS